MGLAMMIKKGDTEIKDITDDYIVAGEEGCSKTVTLNSDALVIATAVSGGSSSVGSVTVDGVTMELKVSYSKARCLATWWGKLKKGQVITCKANTCPYNWGTSCAQIIVCK